ncbi:ATP-binding protein [Evansella tamaricis]|uniref:ATP-binding protein n=1 Tax=Evansella tamaricis TaxID=2069301 RepID=A0ABS6J9Z5_9BACI|nr:ATP-binding protein [Evansella tamaricis]MBU9710506.1 ATP-binding protein [Evansella tamaricis]
MSEKVLNAIPGLIRDSLLGDKRSVELAAHMIIRKIKKNYPNISNEIAEILTTYSAGAPLTRSMGVTPPPTDNESFLSLAKVEKIDSYDENLILDNDIFEVIRRFTRERENAKKLISMGISPPNSILLYGPPGVGKTMIAKYLSHGLGKPLITLDLSATISSYLGKTGQNLKRVLDYAKSSQSILLLDEFDAVAKKRDDPSDLGELKRIVNVLLKELEDWPAQSIIIAATNFPDYLDKAIWRRFDIKLEVPLPNNTVRQQLWDVYLNKESFSIKIDNKIIELINEFVNDISPSDIKQICEKILRQVVIDESDPNIVLIKEVKDRFQGKNGEFNKLLAKQLKQIYGTKITQSNIARILGISTSTVNHHLKSDK